MSDEHETPAQRRQRQIAERIAARSGDLIEEPPAETPAESGFDPEPEPKPEADPAAIERRNRMLAGFDPDVAALFTDEDLAKIEAEEKQRVLNDRKKLALDDLRQRARLENQVELGLAPKERLRDEAELARMEEIVRIRINLPGGGAGHRGQHGFRVNGRLYQHGMTYEVPRSTYDSLVEMHYRVHLNEIRFATMNQTLPGNSAMEIANNVMPRLEVA